MKKNKKLTPVEFNKFAKEDLLNYTIEQTDKQYNKIYRFIKKAYQQIIEQSDEEIRRSCRLRLKAKEEWNKKNLERDLQMDIENKQFVTIVGEFLDVIHSKMKELEELKKATPAPSKSKPTK